MEKTKKLLSTLAGGGLILGGLTGCAEQAAPLPDEECPAPGEWEQEVSEDGVAYWECDVDDDYKKKHKTGSSFVPFVIMNGSRYKNVSSMKSSSAYSSAKSSVSSGKSGFGSGKKGSGSGSFGG